METTNYILDEDFLDMIFKHMYHKRGTFESSRGVETEIGKWKGNVIRYNDVLMALEHLQHDGYLNLEENDREGFPIYRLTYRGYLSYKSDKDGRPYHNLTIEKSWYKTTTKFKTIAIAINAIAILIITGSQVYFDQNDSKLENQLKSSEDELEKSKMENKKLKEENKKLPPTTAISNAPFKTKSIFISPNVVHDSRI